MHFIYLIKLFTMHFGTGHLNGSSLIFKRFLVVWLVNGHVQTISPYKLTGHHLEQP